jgi:hypothetical protein
VIAPIVFDEQPLWRWAVLSAEEKIDGIRFVLISRNKVRSPVMDGLIAKAREDGPGPLLAAWHRDRRGCAVAGREAPDAEA